MREILTLQLGHHANHIATHFWNTQESYFTYDDTISPVDHDVHFRSGIGADGSETFTPRTLIYDLKGGFGALRKINALYGLEEDSRSKGSWDKGMTMQQQTPVQQTQYQKDLEAGNLPPTPLTKDSVRYWSDYNRVFYHPRSSIQIDEYELNSGIQPFEGYSLGSELFQGLNREHDLLDRDVRPFAEECDQMQGIQLFTSADDGWGGFAGEYIAELRDEYGKTGICTWAVERGDRVARDKQLTRTVAVAMSLSNTTSFSSIYVPIRLPPATLPGFLSAVDRSSLWHTSALVAAAIETSTLPTRLHSVVAGSSRISNLGDLAAFLNVGGGQKIAMLSMSVRRGDDKSSVDAHERDKPQPGLSSAAKSDSINCTWENDSKSRNGKEAYVFAEVNVRRGVEADEEEGKRSPTKRHDSIVSRVTSSLGFPMVDSFPSIFPTVGPPDHNGTGSTAVGTSLETSDTVVDRIKGIREVVARYVGVDERENLINGLEEIADGYQHGWSDDDGFFDDE